MNRLSTVKGVVALFLIISTLLITGCGNSQHNEEAYLEGKTMGTTYHIKFYAEQVDPQAIQAEIDAVLVDINQSMSTYIEDSEINTFNRLDANEVMPISDDFRAVISESMRIGNSTKTLDVTMGPLIDLWGFGPDKKPTKRPTDEALANMVSNIGIDKLVLNEQGLAKTVADLELSFSATAKGYGIDKVAELLQSKGITDYMVEILSLIHI